MSWKLKYHKDNGFNELSNVVMGQVCNPMGEFESLNLIKISIDCFSVQPKSCKCRVCRSRKAQGVKIIYAGFRLNMINRQWFEIKFFNGISFEFNHFYFQILSSGKPADCIITSYHSVAWYKDWKGIFGK